jgi:misacylated tRNA(Ala) deacylase
LTECLFRDEPYLKSCSATVVAVHDNGIELDRTVFYPLGGGQAGDTGHIGPWRVIDTRKGSSGDTVLHVLQATAEKLEIGQTLTATLDWERRERLMRYHTALHLLCSVVKAPVSGGRIGADKAHLDFDIEMERLVKEEIEAGVNALVRAGIETRAAWISDAELDARPDLVRTMSVAPPRGEGRVRLLEIPGVDLQACGGTHVRNTAEIGALSVARIRSEGKRNRRVTLVFAAEPA